MSCGHCIISGTVSLKQSTVAYLKPRLTSSSFNSLELSGLGGKATLTC